MSAITIDDQDPAIIYAGADWTRHTNVNASFQLFDNSDTFTDVQGATATYTFTGTGIEYWGNRGRYHGPCEIKMDGKVVATANSNSPLDSDSPVLLYSNANLEQGEHTMVITVVAPSYPNVCEVDRFVVYGSSGNNNNNDGYNNGNGTIANNNQNGNGNQPGKKVPIAAIAGGVGGAVALIALIALFFCFSRRSKKQAQKSPASVSHPSEAKPLVKTPTGTLKKPNDLEKGAAYGVAAHGVPTQQPHSRPLSYASTTSPPTTIMSHPSFQGAPQTPTSAVPLLAPGPPASPNSMGRPNSALSSVSGAPTSQYYPSGPPIAEHGGYGYYDAAQQQQPYGGFPPHQPYPQPQMMPASPPMNPVWATGASSPQFMPHPSPNMQPVAPVQVLVAPSPSVSPAPGPQYPPEKATYSGHASNVPATAGASGSGSNPTTHPAAPVDEKSAHVSEAPGKSSSPAPRVAHDSENLLGAASGAEVSPAVMTDMPPPAYSDAWQGGSQR